MNFLLICFAFNRAMGIMYILVTKPFENCLKRGSILDLNADLLTLHTTLTEWSRDGSLPLQRVSSF